MTRRIVMAAVIVVLAAAVQIITPAMPSHAAAQGDCRILANMPSPVTLSSTKPKLYAWATLQCASASSVALAVCGVSFAPTAVAADRKTEWCLTEIVKPKAGGATFVRTPLHACTRGRDYTSKVRILGRPWDESGWRLCRSL